MNEAFELTPAQQAAGVDRIGESLALLSGAGCGKTFVLARRFTELLLADRGDGDDALSRLVALTFTEKAAVEMSQRVRAILTALAESAQGQTRRKLLRWIDELPEARISTIHGFCSSLLRSRAIEAGVDPSFTVCADSLLASRLADESADRALLAAVEAQHAGAVRLLETYTFTQLAEAMAVILDRRTAFSADHYADAERIVERWDGRVRHLRDEAWARMDADADLRQMLDDLAAFECTDDGDRLLPIRDELLDAAGWILADRAERTVGSFARVNDVRAGNCGSDRNWGSERGSAKRVRHAMKAVIQAVDQYALHAEDLGEADRQAAAALAALVELAGRAQAIYAAEKRKRGLLDFTDLLAKTEQLLRDRPGVRRGLAERIGQLLIDECQDTDAFQVAMLSRLVLPEADDPSAAPTPGRLFVVGDPKQSIYRFRGAQVEVFADLCDRLGPDNTERLDLSFRTHGAGVAFVNDLFARLMGDDYSPVEARRAACPPAPSVEIVLAGIPGGQVTSAAEASAAQAGATAQRIREMLDAGERIVWDRQAETWRQVQAGDIAILFARMTNSLEYERQLQNRGVPYYVVAGSGFFRRQEVLDVLNALGVVDNAFDDVAFMGVLRSGLFALDDNALMHLAEAMEPPYLPALTEAVAAGKLDDMLGDRLGEVRLAALKEAVNLLGGLGRLKDALGVDRVTERLLAATGYEAALLAQQQGKRMLGNVRLLLDRARSAGAQGTVLADFLTQMKDLVLHEARYEQAAVAGEADNVVRIMTIHKAKGIEFPVVILPDLNAARRTGGDDLLVRSDWGLTWRSAGGRPYEDEDAPEPLSARLARTMETRDQHAEDIRKWYVAVTRHEDHLVLVGADWRGADGQFRSGGCFMSQMDEHLHIADAVDEGRQTIPYADGRYVAAVRRWHGLSGGAVAPAQAESLGHRGPVPTGRRMMDAAEDAADLARAIVAAGGDRAAAPPLVGPVSPDIGTVALAVSTLGAFERCEMFYNWRYTLRVPEVATARPAPGAPAPAPLDPATLGTLYHRCMELLDVTDPQPAETLVERAAGELDLLDVPGLDRVAAEFETMLADFGQHDLCRSLAGARADLRELDFEMQVGSALLRGQIDLLFQDAHRAWHIVDYKSDRVGPEGAAAHAEPYQLQMLTYALAAAKHLGQPPTDAMLYFLRPSAVCRIDTSAAAIARAEDRIGGIARRLITAARSGQYARCSPSGCTACPYRPLCRR